MSLELTAAGTDLLMRALAGTASIHFTHIKIGSGADAGSTATDLSHPELDPINIRSIDTGDVKVTLKGSYNNNDVVTGFRMTELGVFATDPDDSSAEILYAYAYTAPASADYVPPNADRTLETELTLLVYVGEAASVTAEIASGIYVTEVELEEHEADPDAHGNLYVRAGRLGSSQLGQKATAEGDGNTASGRSSHAEGEGNTAAGVCSHAEGGLTEALGQAAHAEGMKSQAEECAAHAEGFNTRANARSSHSEGLNSRANGESSHAEGEQTIAGGASSHAEGNQTRAVGRSQHVFGERNVYENDPGEGNRGTYVEIVGNGDPTLTNSYSNARTLDWYGNEVLAGKLTLGAGPTADMDAATKKYVDDAIAAAIAALNT